jgi:hypothetical protein
LPQVAFSCCDDQYWISREGCNDQSFAAAAGVLQATLATTAAATTTTTLSRGAGCVGGVGEKTRL